MSNVVIQIENVSKQYRLGEVSTGSLGHDLNRWWHRVRGKEDPYLSVTGENIRTRRRERTSKAEGGNLKAEKVSPSGFTPHPSSLSSDYVWALRDINFEVREGEVLGIIGRNGAGKSTLLKILSRVTAPTLGEIRVKGRIASLLEVGTGFHQDLTGRENIYLNGAVLGMTKPEISSKLEEIVEFSGCAAYLETPVKRYSSGMVVRLGFAVAAHLEPEILIVDEVLAVGDIEFQRKCLGKMENMAGQGRTVLFVSHNMAAIKRMCHNALLIENGMVKLSGTAGDVVDQYLASETASAVEIRPEHHRIQTPIQVESVLLGESGHFSQARIHEDEPLVIRLRLRNQYRDVESIRVAIELLASGECITTLMSPAWSIPSGETNLVCRLPGHHLCVGMIGFNIGIIRLADNRMADFLAQIASIVVIPPDDPDSLSDHARRARGLVRLPAVWESAG